MRRRYSPLWIALVIGVLVLVGVATGFGLFLAGEAGQLPWQPDPTRIVVTPFVDIPENPTPVATAEGAVAPDRYASTALPKTIVLQPSSLGA